MRRFAMVDFGQYVRAIGVLARNPVIMLAPLAASMCTAALGTLLPNSGGDTVNSLAGGIWQLIFFLINAFGLGVALIAADAAWKRGKVSFDDALDEGKRKAGDILMAAVGLSFIASAASLVGGFVSPLLAIPLSIAAIYFFIYTLPAAAIGGVPGSAALSISLDRVKSNYLAAALLFVAGIVGYIGLVLFATPYLLQYAGHLPGVAERIITAVVLALYSAYFAIVLAKTYSDVTFTVPRW